MSDFKWRHFEGEIILWAVRWYCRYGSVAKIALVRERHFALAMIAVMRPDV